MMPKLFSSFMRHYHALSDKDFIWFPFTKLRPAPHEAIGLPKLLLMVLCFALYGALLWPLKQWILRAPITREGWLWFTLKCGVFFLVWFSCVTRPLWNQRARSVKRS